MLTKASPINLSQPKFSKRSILILGKTPLGNRIKKITAIVFRINQITPLKNSIENIGSPGV